MNSSAIELYYSDTTDLDANRCEECGSIDFEHTDTRVFCIRCGLVSKESPYGTASTALESLIHTEQSMGDKWGL